MTSLKSDEENNYLSLITVGFHKHARLSGILGQGWPSVELSAATVRLPLVPGTVWSSSRSSCFPSTDASDGDTAKHMP